MKRVKFGCGMIAALLISIFMTTEFSHAEESLKAVVQNDFAPFTSIKDGKAEGLYVEIIEGAFKKAGIKSDIQGVPWNRVVLMTDENQINFSFPWREKKERFEKYHMVGPITHVGSRTFFWAKKGSNIKWSKIEDLSQYNILAIEGFAYPKVFEDNLTKLKVTKRPLKTENLLQMLSAGRVDLIISDETVLGDEARKANLQDQIEPVGDAMEVVQRYVGLNKANTDMAQKIQAALDAFKTTDDYKNIMKKYNIQ